MEYLWGVLIYLGIGAFLFGLLNSSSTLDGKGGAAVGKELFLLLLFWHGVGLLCQAILSA